ncbi:MAG: hypothetical protein RI944_863 [Actinomycetota bacterium]
MKKILKFVLILFGIYIAISVVSGIYQGVTKTGVASPTISDEYQSQYDEKYNAFIVLRTAELIPLGLNNIYDEQNKPSIDKAKFWCEENFVKMEEISRKVNGLPSFTPDEYQGAIDGCADAFMAKAGE